MPIVNADSLVGVNLLYIILFIVPGLVGMKFYRREADVLDDDDRIDAIVYSILLSIVSFYIIYTIDWLVSGSALTIDNLTPFALEHFYWGYLGVLVTAVATGSVYGRYKYHLVNNESFSTRREPFIKGVFTITPNIGLYRFLRWIWSKLGNLKTGVLKKIRLHNLCSDFYTRVWRPFYNGDSSTSTAVWDQVFGEIDATVRVTTTQGDEITGKVLDSGSFAQTRDLLLSIQEPPSNASDDDGWEEMDYVYVHSQDISHVSIEDVDLDRKVIEEIDYEMSQNPELDSTFPEVDSEQTREEQTSPEASSKAKFSDDDLMRALLEEEGISVDEIDMDDIEDYETFFSVLREKQDPGDEIRDQLKATGELGED